MIKKITIYIISTLMLFFALVLTNGVLFWVLDIESSLKFSIRYPKYFYLYFLAVAFIYFTTIVVILYFSRKLFLKLKNTKLDKIHFIGVFLFILLVGAALLFLGDVKLSYDPKDYFSEGVAIANSFDHFTVTNIYHQRTLFYTVPIFLIFPDSLESVQIVNLLFFLTSGLIFTFLIFKEFGKHIAFYFIVFFSIYYEFYTSISIASHDIAFIFYFSIIFFMLYLLLKSKSKYKSSILILAFFVVIIDFKGLIGIPIFVYLETMFAISISKTLMPF